MIEKVCSMNSKIINIQSVEKVMIQNIESMEHYREEHEELTKEISEYRRINASLKKKIQARDKKISYLFSCMDQMSKSSIQNTLDNVPIKKNRSQLNSQVVKKKEIHHTQPKNKEKENMGHASNNIFKESQAQSVKMNFKLPTLERKSIFVDNPQITDSRPKIVKIAIEKLIPLKPQDVKKKFEEKFK